MTMTYTNQEFAHDLEKQLQQGFNVEVLSHWAYSLKIDKHPHISRALRNIVEQIAVMSEGYEFEFSEQELADLASKLGEFEFSEHELLEIYQKFCFKKE